MAIDWALIEAFEGRGRRDGYVPHPEAGRSGVTLATGVDLGARSPADLDRLDIPDALRGRLAPYTGHKGGAAVAVLAANPLTLTDDEVAALDRAARGEAVARLRAAYDAAVSEGAFDALPDAARTVVASVAFQYGSLARRTPKFWHLVTARDWDGAIAELEDFGDGYPTRRRREAAYLRSRLG